LKNRDENAMPMSVNNPEIERLAETEVARQALREKKERLEAAGSAAHRERLLAFLQDRVWPKLPRVASRRWTREQEARLVGYGKHGEPV
jgi:hypothetical protein